MVLVATTSLKSAQQLKRYLLSRELLLQGYRHEKSAAGISFPIVKKFKAESLKIPVTFSEADLASTPKGRLKDIVASTLSAQELAVLTSSFDIVGSIAIVEIDESLVPREREIAETILSHNKQVMTVLKKGGGHEGELRLQKMTYLAGVDTRETIVTENGVRLGIDVEKVYYSVRSATERKRIAQLVVPGERVLVMFSGAAPYPCVIAKLAKPSEVVGIELNERGHELGVLNIRMNKLGNVVLIQGDVRDVVPQLVQKNISFDRIVMPLPHTGHDFLDSAFAVAKKGTIIHLYDFEKEGEFEHAAAKAEQGAARNGKKIKVLGIVPSGQHSPRVYRVCCDFEVL